jgi:hypothetical protein
MAHRSSGKVLIQRWADFFREIHQGDFGAKGEMNARRTKIKIYSNF